MNEHFIATVERGELRVYAETILPGQNLRRLEIVDPAEYGADELGYADRELSFGTRFTQTRGGVAGFLTEHGAASRHEGSRHEGSRRGGRYLARTLDSFLEGRPGASWDFAAPAGLYRPVIEALSPGVRRRLKRVFSNERLNERLAEERLDYAGVWSAGGR